jgi:hypothetical protein
MRLPAYGLTSRSALFSAQSPATAVFLHKLSRKQQLAHNVLNKFPYSLPVMKELLHPVFFRGTIFFSTRLQAVCRPDARE